MKTLLPLRAAWRLARAGIHLAAAAATVLCLFPFAARRFRLALKRRWSRQLLAVLGVQLRVDGACSGSMRVANHVSWLDVFAINAVAPSAFVAKDDVRGWPLIGWLCARTETIFIRRDSRRDARAVARGVADRLAAGVEVVVFPEGTTGDGERVLPFRSALLQGAIDAGACVQPVALRYESRNGDASEAAAYCGDTSLGQSLWRIAASDGLTLRLCFLAPEAASGLDRRALAACLHARIAAAIVAFRAIAETRDDHAGAARHPPRRVLTTPRASAPAPLSPAPPRAAARGCD